MKFLKRIKNLWRLSSLELWESWDEHGYLDKTRVKHLVAKTESKVGFPKEKRMAQIIKRDNPIEDFLNS